MKIDSDGWVYCPRCGGKTRLKVSPETVIKDLPLYCPKCKSESNVNIQKMKIAQSQT